MTDSEKQMIQSDYWFNGEYVKEIIERYDISRKILKETIKGFTVICNCCWNEFGLEKRYMVPTNWDDKWMEKFVCKKCSGLIHNLYSKSGRDINDFESYIKYYNSFIYSKRLYNLKRQYDR